MKERATYKSEPDLEREVTAHFIESEDFDQRGAKADGHRQLGSADGSKLSVVVVNEAAVQLLRWTDSTGHLADLPHIHYTFHITTWPECRSSE